MTKFSFSDFLRKCKNEGWTDYTADIYKKYLTAYGNINEF